MIKYGLNWPDDSSALDIELAMVRNKGTANGKGNGHKFHYQAAMVLLWPELDRHRWSDLAAKEVTRPNHKITSFMGPGSTAKTHEAAKWGLIEYFADPDNTCVLVSSTDIRGLKLRIWGEICDLWQKAIDRWPTLAGHMLESRIAITTDALDDDGDLSDRQVRDMRKAICGIPCIQDKKYVGLAKYHGIKQKRMRLVGDELALMGGAFLKSIANLNNNTDFQAVVCFNPNDPLDPGGQVAEPVDGWTGHMEPTKTEVWDTRFMSGRCINFVGTDSPNFDDPNQPNRFPYLIGPKKIAELISAFGKDSFEYYSQGIGVMKVGQLSKRVITRDLCRRMGALTQPEWAGPTRIRIYALDSAYGGDRCVGGWAEFGLDPDGKMLLCFHKPRIIHITADDDPENIIARAVKDDCEAAEIPPENMFHDSTGRGRLGTALSRIWSPQTNPIEFGGTATDRPVSLDIYVTDPFTRERRLKLCSEQYDRFVTELWWSVAYAIEGGQVRGLPEDVMDELCMRMWKNKKNDRKSIEPKSGTAENPGMKERTGRSPDLGDWCFLPDTRILTPKGTIPISDLKAGDAVVTPFGITTINEVRVREADVITTVEFSNGKSLSGLGDHKIFTWNNGWVRLDGLTIDMEIESSHNLPIWNTLNALFTKDTNSSFKAMVDTIRTAGTLRLRDFYTDASGLTTMGLFLKACASITKMAIGPITTLPIWNSWKNAVTCLTTCANGGKTQITGLKHCLLGPQQELPPLLSGIALKPEGSGTESTQRINGRTGRRNHAHALSAARFSLDSSRKGAQSDCALSGAKTRGIYEGLQTILGCAWFVAKTLLLTGTARRKVAPVTVRQSSSQESRKVYNLTLDDHNAYYANDILVSNCAIIVEGARQRGFQISRLGGAKDYTEGLSWLTDSADKFRTLLKSKQLATR